MEQWRAPRVLLARKHNYSNMYVYHLHDIVCMIPFLQRITFNETQWEYGPIKR